MNNWIDWHDQVDSFKGCFDETPQPDGSILHTPVRGTVQQEGTPQDAEHFGLMMDGIIEAHTVLGLLLNYARQNAWEIEHGSVSLTNSQSFPFNNSSMSVALATMKESTDYIVLAEVASSKGNVGEIEISDKLKNGFKIAYTGSAISAIINYTVIGGLLK